MSSVNWQKVKTASEAKAKIRHNDKEKRLEDNHENGDINKALTSRNLALDGRNYDEKCRAYDDRVEWCKSNMKRVRKDAVTMIGLNIKLPAGLTEAPYDKQVEWCQETYKIVQDFVGKDNIVSATADFDEVHEFYNPETGKKELSRPEVDIKFVPEMDGKLNAKAWQTKGNMRSINQQIEDMTQCKFNMEFMTGKGGKNVSTETLKAQSVRAEAEHEAQQIVANAQTRERQLEERERRSNMGRKIKESQLRQREMSLDSREKAVEAFRTDLLVLALKYADDDAERQEMANMDVTELCEVFMDGLQELEDDLENDRRAFEEQQQEKLDDFQHREDALDAQKKAQDERETALDERESAWWLRVDKLNAREKKCDERDAHFMGAVRRYAEQMTKADSIGRKSTRTTGYEHLL